MNNQIQKSNAKTKYDEIRNGDLSFFSKTYYSVDEEIN